MADRVMYDKMLEGDMFPHLLTLNPPNLVEIHPKQKKLRIFIENLSEKKISKFFLAFLFFFVFFVVGVSWQGWLEKCS